MLRLLAIALLWGLSTAPAQADTSELIQKYEISRSAVHSIKSNILGRIYQIYVRTPTGYYAQKNKNKHYPVVYINDGPYTFQVASGTTHLSRLSKHYEAVILVGISFAEGEDPMASRTRDMTPTKWADWTKRTGHETGGADNYLAFLDSQLMPFVENKYRVDRKRRTLAGHSFGGLFAAWVMLNKPNLFEKYIISSPSLWFGKKVMFKAEEIYASKNNNLNATVYFGTGEYERPKYGTKNDLVSDQKAFVKKLRSRKYKGLVIREKILEDIDHLTAFPINFTLAYRWMFR